MVDQSRTMIKNFVKQLAELSVFFHQFNETVLCCRILVTISTGDVHPSVLICFSVIIINVFL
jgi:hypothetical protein